MSKIRMNTEFRNKILNRYVESAEQEITQEKDAYNSAREKVDQLYPQAFKLGSGISAGQLLGYALHLLFLYHLISIKNIK